MKHHAETVNCYINCYSGSRFTETREGNLRPASHSALPASLRPPVRQRPYWIGRLTAGAREPFTDRSGRAGFTYRHEPTPPRPIYRRGGKNPGNLVPRTEDRGRLSFWESLNASFAGAAVFLPGDEYIVIDANLLARVLSYSTITPLGTSQSLTCTSRYSGR